MIGFGLLIIEILHFSFLLGQQKWDNISSDYQKIIDHKGCCNNHAIVNLKLKGLRFRSHFVPGIVCQLALIN